MLRSNSKCLKFHEEERNPSKRPMDSVKQSLVMLKKKYILIESY
jgi:hypothetical protein